MRRCAPSVRQNSNILWPTVQFASAPWEKPTLPPSDARVFAPPNPVNTSLCLSGNLNTFRLLRTPWFCVHDGKSDKSWNDQKAAARSYVERYFPPWCVWGSAFS